MVRLCAAGGSEVPRGISSAGYPRVLHAALFFSSWRFQRPSADVRVSSRAKDWESCASVANRGRSVHLHDHERDPQRCVVVENPSLLIFAELVG